MADKYSTQMTGILDGTLVPPRKADGRQVNARANTLLATKVTGEAWDSGDVIHIGKKPAGMIIKDIKAVASASLGSATLDIGYTGAPDVYVDGATMTAVNVPTSLGPEAQALVTATATDQLEAEQDLIVTIGAANIAGGTNLVLIIEMAGLKA